MTQKEVEIEVQKTETDTISVCDGCGLEIGTDGMVFENSLESRSEKLHFCSESCVDSVRATGRRESDECQGYIMDMVWVTIGLWYILKRLWSPYGYHHDMEVQVIDYAVAFAPCGFIALLHEVIAYPGDGHWRAFLLSVMVNSIYAILYVTA